MRRGGQGKRRDANEKAIIAALRVVGATVQQLSGIDVPDLLVGHHGVNFLLEVKMPKGELSDGQFEWVKTWRGREVWVVRSPDEALAAIGCGARRQG